MSLQQYRQKRNFLRTPEPSENGTVSRAPSCFVIQKHEATRLHYDFRLEVGGRLVSWAVPKGLPLQHGEKRLAVKVEDHPLSYAGFEGVIPAGQYGGGTVMVWDQGTFSTPGKSPASDLRAGKLHVVLAGRKLTGEWYLVRLKEEDQWLVIRGGEDHPPIPKRLVDRSVLSGKTLRQLARPKPPPGSSSARAAAPSAGVKKLPPPPWVPPMMAKLVARQPEGDWKYEIKFDGFRGMVRKQAGQTAIYSRTRQDLTSKFPEIASALQSLKARHALLDGELVALDADGRSSFQLLQAFEQGAERPPLYYYYAFDLLELDGQSLLSCPLEERKARLKKILPRPGGPVRYSPLLGSDAGALLKLTQRLRLEGLIGKRAGSVYEPGRRSGTWIKLKQVLEEEFVIGGYTDPAGSRLHFGALLVGYYEHGSFRYAGKVGTGFNSQQLRILLKEMNRHLVAKCPFEPPPEPRPGRYGQGLTAAALKRCHWLKPQLVAQIRFSEWTREGRLRQPVYLGLRKDKPAREVVRETPSAA